MFVLCAFLWSSQEREYCLVQRQTRDDLLKESRRSYCLLFIAVPQEHRVTATAVASPKTVAGGWELAEWEDGVGDVAPATQ